MSARPLPRVIDVIPRIQLRGAEVFAQHLELALRDRFRCSLLPLYSTEPNREARRDGADHLDIRRGVRDGPARMIRTAMSLRSRAGRARPDIVVAHGGDPLRYAVAVGLQRLAPIVYVRIASVTPDLRTPARTRTLRAAYRRVDRVVAVSESLRNELIDSFQLDAAKVRVIPNGRMRPAPLDGPRREAIRRQIGAEEGEVLAIWVGRFVREKDPFAAADLAARLRTLAPQTRLVMVGDGPSHTRILTAAEGVANLVLIGERADAQDLIGSADLLVSTSITEGAPGVFVEALIAGVPVVCYDLGGAREVVSDQTGVLVPPGDRAGLAAGVALLANEPAVRRRRAEAATIAGSRFEIGPISDSYAALYEELLSERRPPRT